MGRDQRQLDLVPSAAPQDQRLRRAEAGEIRAAIRSSVADQALLGHDDHRVLADETRAVVDQARSRADRRKRRKPAFAGPSASAILPASDHFVATTKAGFPAGSGAARKPAPVQHLERRVDGAGGQRHEPLDPAGRGLRGDEDRDRAEQRRRADRPAPAD